MPAFFGETWTDVQFLVFNAVWLTTFLLAAWGLRRRAPLGALVVLFVAVGGGVANGVAHLVLVMTQGRYFPGAWTAPLCLIVGIVLLRQLLTRPEAR